MKDRAPRRAGAGTPSPGRGQPEAQGQARARGPDMDAVQDEDPARLRQERDRLARVLADLQDALAAARAQHEDLLSSLQDAVIVVSPVGVVVLWNPAAEELLKISASSAVGKAFDRLLPQAEALGELLVKALAAGRSYADFEASLVRPDGVRVTVSAVASILAGAGGEPRGAVLALRDISRLRELEETLRRSDRLAALGQMAAGVAHEVRNPLVGIRAAAQFLEGDPAFTPGLREYTGVIIREVDRLNAIVEDLLAFASPKPVQFAPCNLNQVLEETLAVKGTALAAAGISVARVYDPQLPPILGDPPRLHQVFLNLLRNAAEAMPGGGALTVRTRFERLSARLGGRAAAVAEVADAGPGVPPDRVPHLFNPFFTTKPRGTGLGLAISLRIVEDHGGAIEVQAGAGRGATFAVVLPLAPAAGEASDA
jgi:two-component system nitrogen regulation sensor histidine kinase GlnL